LHRFDVPLFSFLQLGVTVPAVFNIDAVFSLVFACAASSCSAGFILWKRKCRLLDEEACQIADNRMIAKKPSQLHVGWAFALGSHVVGQSSGENFRVILCRCSLATSSRSL